MDRSEKPFSLDIAFYAEGISFDGRPITEKSLGGSETAVWYMARELARLGHRVTVFNNCEQAGDYDGVAYRQAQILPQISPKQQYDLFVVSRAHNALHIPLRANLRWFWTHDIPYDPPERIPELLGSFGAFSDQVMTVSEYHTALYRSLKPKAFRGKDWDDAINRTLWTTRNGVDLQMLRRQAQGVSRKANRMIYCSRPERGLDYLLGEVWPRLQVICPDLELGVCSYDTASLPSSMLTPEARAFYARIDQQIEQTPGVTNLGALNKAGLAKALAASTLMLYPCRFPEVGCIAAMEAQALGVVVVTTHDFALTETVAYGGVRVEGHALPPDPAYTQAFVDRTIELLRDDLERNRLAKQGIAHIEKNHQWSQVAKEWEARAYEQLEIRVATKGRRICESLLYNSAVVAAHEMAKEEGYTDLQALAGHYLEHHDEDPDAYDIEGAAQRTGWELTRGRWAAMASCLLPPGPGIRRVLDVGCGAGGLIGHLLKYRPDLREVDGTDFSPKLVESTQAFVAEQGWSDRSKCWIVDSADPGVAGIADIYLYDAVFAGEILEHQIDPVAFIDHLESRVRVGGQVILSVPSGPWESNSFEDPRHALARHHVQDFTYRDIRDLFGAKADFKAVFLASGLSKRETLLGAWVISYTKRAGRPTGAMDYRRRWMTERPLQKLALCMIVKDAASNIRRCLESVIEVVDEIHLCVDAKTKDPTREIIREFEVRYWPAVHVRMFEFEDFAQARNVSLEGVDADWILWMDADERLDRGNIIRRYLEGPFFESFSLRQNNLTVDSKRQGPQEFPLRVFRGDRGYKFWGKIHEDPGLGLNESIEPAFRINEAQVVHYGYEDEGIRREKAIRRNLALLNEDRRANPERTKGPFLVARDYLNLARWRTERGSGEIDEQGLTHIRNGCMIFLERYASPAAPWHDDALKIYQEALQWLASIGAEVQPGWGTPFEAAFVATFSRNPRGMAGVKPEPDRRWFANREELRDFMARAGILMYEQLEPFAGLRQRHTVIPDDTATSVDSAHANGAAPHAPGSSQIEGEECPSGALARTAVAANIP